MMRIWSMNQDGSLSWVGGGWKCGDGLYRLTHDRGRGGVRLDGRRRRKIPRFTDKDGTRARRELMAYDLEHYPTLGVSA